MDFNNGIIYVVLTFLMYVVDTIVKTFTDIVDVHASKKKRLFKHSIASVVIVLVYIVLYYLTTQTSVFSFSSEDNALLLLVLVFSFLYLNLNAIVSTLINKKLLKAMKEKYTPWCMIGVNLLVILIMTALASIVLDGKNVIVNEFEGKILDSEYTITVPANTYFDFDLEKSEDNTDGGIKDYLNASLSNSEYLLKKGSEVKLKRGTYVKYQDENSTFRFRKGGDKVAKNLDISLTSASVWQLKKDVDVKLKKDTTVLLGKTNGYLSVPMIHIYFICGALSVYYAFKLATPFRKWLRKAS